MAKKPIPQETIDKALGLKTQINGEGKRITIREYLRELLLTLWREGEGFSGKRPFGDSGWGNELFKRTVLVSATHGNR